MTLRSLVLGLAGLILLAGVSLPAEATQPTGPAAAPRRLVATGERLTVAATEIDDLKAVLATVDSKDRIEARVRTGGTVVTLNADEGSQVEAGQVLAVVADPKLALQIRAVDAQIRGLESRLATAKLDYDRADKLQERGITPQSRVDQLKTAFDVASNDLKTAKVEREVLQQQTTEGQVLAPSKGRVLKVPVTAGSVVMAGESVATIAANDYLLRIEVPERHARFMKRGDPVRTGQKGLASLSKATTEGHIVQVYPELRGGRVVADAEVPDLGGYFIGERVLVWISAGRRRTVVVPETYIFERFGQDYARIVDLSGSAIDVVVQRGQPAPLADGRAGIEVLAGLTPGDVLVSVGDTP